jgi:CBS domain-containing protein
VNPRDRVVTNIMQTDVPSVKESDVLGIGQLLRLRWLRDMPVVNDTKLVGVVSIGDLLRACIIALQNTGPNPREDPREGIRIADVMIRDVVSIAKDVTLGEAAELMKFHEIGFLPMVGDDGQLIGAVTESDLVSATLL